MKAYDFIETPGTLDEITQTMHDFDANHEWQAGFNDMLDNFRIVEKVVPCMRTIRVVEPIAVEG